MARVKDNDGNTSEENVLTDAEDDNTDHYVVVSQDVEDD
jgi:hypothetical protein